MAMPPERRNDVDALVPEPVSRNVGRTLAHYGIGFSLLALIAAAALFRSWTVPLWLGLSGEVADQTEARKRGLGREDLRNP